MNICPNLNNKEIKKEFDELINTFGENIAYYLWDITNGEGLLNQTFNEFMEISNDRAYALSAAAIEAKAIHNGTFMKAPNGKDSNLSRIQWIQARTPQFKEWFGDWESNSEKIIENLDENNEPLSEYVNIKNNLYYNLNSSPENQRLEIVIRYLTQNGILVKKEGAYYIKKGNNINNAVSTIRQLCNKYFCKFKIITEGSERKVILEEYYNKDDKVYRYAGKPGDIEKILNFLTKTFYGIKFKWIDKAPPYMKYGANAFVKGNIVYLIKGRVTPEIIVEEFLHPFVTSIQLSNHELFYSLLKNARKDFQNLYREIESVYTNEHGFTQSDRDNELVTQALSRYIVKIKTKENLSVKIKDLVHNFFAWIWKSIKESLQMQHCYIDDAIEYLIDEEKLPELTLEELASIIAADDTIIWSYASDKVRYSLSQDVLENDEYDNILSQMPDQTEESMTYAARTAIDRTRQAYLNDQQNQFEENYRQQQQKKLNPQSFFQKVLLFFKTAFGKNRIKDPSSKEKETARIQAFTEFNETLRWNIINALKNLINIDFINEQIDEFYNNKNFDAISNLLQLVDDFIKKSYIQLQTREQIYNSLMLLKKSEFDHFKTVDEFVDAFLDLDKTKYSADQQYEMQDVYNRINDYIELIANAASKEEFNTILAFYYSQDFNLVNENRRLYDKIKHGYKSRLLSIEKSTMRSSKDIIRQIQQKIEKLESIKSIDPDTIYSIIDDFLLSARQELDVLNTQLTKYLQDIQKVNANVLMYINTDLLGFYESVFNDCSQNMSKSNTGMTQSQIDDLRNTITETLSKKLAEANQLYQQVCDAYLDNFIDAYIEEQVGIGDKEAIKYRFKQVLYGELLGGQVSTAQRWVGDANKASSIVIRAIQHMLNDADRDVNRSTVKKGHELMRLFDKYKSVFDKLNPNNPFKPFVELDKNGLPTGNFVRALNYGQFQKDLKNKHKILSKKYNIPLNKKGFPIWNLDIQEQQDVYNQYMDELDDWLDHYCNRRYKAEYYKQRRKVLSRDTIEIIDKINSQIRLLLEKCTDSETGYIYINRLTDSERQKLDSFYQQLDELSIPYTIVRAGKSILKFEPKTGDQFRMAQEIQEWNNLVSKHVQRSPDYDKYAKALDAIENPTEKLEFEKHNTRTQLSKEFYERLSNCSTADQTEEYLKQSAILNRLINLSKYQRGYYMPNLYMYGEEAWREIKRIEELKDSLKSKGFKGSESFDNIAVMLPVTMTHPTTGQQIPVIDYIMEQAQNALSVDPDAVNKVYDLFYKAVITDRGVVFKPLSVFYYVAPKDSKYIENIPCSGYTKLTGGDWVNLDFNDNDQEQYQPKELFYRNKEYYKMIKDEDKKRFYDAIIETMEQSLRLIPAYKNFSKYKMPQITADSDDIRERYAALINYKGVYKSLEQNLQVNETDDEIYSEDLAKRADGSFVKSINVRYIRQLEDPTLISMDVLGSVLKFYQMAQNFNRKSEVVPIIELMIDVMRKSTKDSTAAERANTILEMYGYGKKQKGFGDPNKKMGKAESFSVKMISHIRKATSMLMLAGNFVSGTVGSISGWFQTFIQAFAGRQYDFRDRMWTTLQLFKEIPAAMASFMHGNTYSKVQAAMQHNGLATNIENSFTNRHKVGHKQLKRLLGMWMFTAGDYNVNAIIMLSTYHAHRLVQNPQTGEFSIMNEEEYVDLCSKLGISRKDAVRQFDNYSGNNLWNMYELSKDGNFVLKSNVIVKDIDGKKITINPKDYVTKRIENRISGGTADKASIANGVINPHGQVGASQNPILKMFFLMRGFLVSTGWEHMKTGNDYRNTYYDKQKIRNFDSNNSVRGQFNFETGHVEPGIFSAVGHCVKFFIKDYIPSLLQSLVHLKKISTSNKLSQSDISSAKLFLGEALGTALFFMLSSLFTLAAKKDPDDWWMSALALIFARVSIEISSPISLNTVSDLWTSVTVCQKLLDNYLSIFKKMSILFGYGDHEPDEIIKSGSYKGNPYWFKSFLESSGMLFLDPDMWAATGYYRTFTPVIPDVTESKYNKYVKKQSSAIRNIENNDFSYIFSKEGLSDFGNIIATPMGVQSKFDYYHKNVQPATMLPDIKEKKDRKKSKSRSRNIKRPSRRRINRNS